MGKGIKLPQKASDRTRTGGSPLKKAIVKKRKREELGKNHLTAMRMLALADVPSGRRRYAYGQHGYKKSEQKRLFLAHGLKVTGDTHESEHVVGFEPLNQTSGLQRGKGTRARSLENQAPAYQEVKQLHRDHIGTGTTNTADSSGMNSEQYRTAQRTAITAGDVSSAVQLNQLGYAFDPNFRSAMQTTEGKEATDSYSQMVASMNGLTYANFDQNVTVPVDAKQKAEMILARHAAITGEFPSVTLENQVRGHFGLPAYQSDEDLGPASMMIDG